MDTESSSKVPDPDYRHGQPAGGQVAGAPSDNTSVTAVLERLGEDGFTCSFRPGGSAGSLRCGQCDHEAPVQEYRDVLENRLEGASDPDDMVLVVAAVCPSCGTGGTVVLGYGPESSEADSDIVAALPRTA